MNDREPADDTDSIIAARIRRTVGISALRKIGDIVASEQQADAEKEAVLRWSIRYGWILLLVALLLFAFAIGYI